MGNSPTFIKEISITVPNTEDIEKGLGPIYRHIGAKDALVSNHWENTYSLYDLFIYGVTHFPTSPCLGRRRVVNNVLEKTFTWFSYFEVGEMVKQFGSGLKNLKLVDEISCQEYHKVDGSQHECLGIFCRNCCQWLVAEYGAFHNNYSIVPLYDTLGIASLRLVLDEVGFSCIVCTEKELVCLITLLEEKLAGKLRAIITVDAVESDLRERIQKLNITLYSFEDIIEAGKKALVEPKPPGRRDTALIVYTSGSTGTPKGVIQLHENIASLSQASQTHDPRTICGQGDFHISYLPLPHAFEQFIIGNILSGGGAIGMYSGDKRLLMEDIAILKPTVFASVPRIFTRMKDTIEYQILKSSSLVRTLYKKGMEAKMAGLEQGYLSHRFYDSLVFKKIKAKLGFTRLRWAISGSAPMSVDTMKFLRCVFGVPVFEGYGMTESGGGICCGELDDVSRFGNCGGPTHCCEIRLVSIPELNYFITDKTHTSNDTTIKCNGRGEICLHGFNIFPGYFQRPELTKETIDENGWFHTGDVGLWDDKGSIHVIDRKKNILKLSQGEYVAVEALENVYQSSSYVDQIFVYGDSYQNSLVAVIVPDESNVKLWCRENGNKEESFEILCASEQVKDLIMNDLYRVWKEKKLNGIERIAAISIHSKPFSVEENLLTPTMKLKRNDLGSRYKGEIFDLYQEIAKKNQPKM